MAAVSQARETAGPLVPTPTQERLLVAAERLFAEAGFQVSLREIGSAAGQRNHSAVQYHFGDRAGLVDALYRFRMAPLDQRRAELVDDLRARGATGDVESLLRAYIAPMAELVLARPGQTWYLRLVARYIISGSYTDFPVPSGYYAQFGAVEKLLLAADPRITQSRVYLVTLHVVSVLASLEARLSHQPRLVDGAEEEIEDLVATAYAVATAPGPGR